ncbi:MAG TPA: hypothetical protein VH797_11280 [Nitrososphaeraceae archaeon]
MQFWLRIIVLLGSLPVNVSKLGIIIALLRRGLVITSQLFSNTWHKDHKKGPSISCRSKLNNTDGT